MDPSMHVSHETIYRTLFVQARGALGKELIAHLRSGKTVAPSEWHAPLEWAARADRGRDLDS